MSGTITVQPWCTRCRTSPSSPIGSNSSTSPLFSSNNTPLTSAGLRALRIYISGSSSNLTISMFSPPNWLTMAWTRAPRGPTHVPTGSTLASREKTATFARSPASRTIPLISTIPWLISGTSFSNKRFNRSGAVRETNTCGPRVSSKTRVT